MNEVEKCIEETIKHQDTVKNLMEILIKEILHRSFIHDASKLQPEELNGFIEYTPKLKNCTYGSDEYKKYLEELKPSLNHHYENNSHHPEYYKDSIERFCTECNKGFNKLDEEYYIEYKKCPNCETRSHISKRYTLRGMNLIDILEMICDWKAATLRHDDGDISKSIEINQKRFGYSDEMKQILKNTIDILEGGA